MADEEDGARVFFQQLFQQFQGIDIQVVGRLIENQHVGRLGEQARQQQTVALATG